MNEKKVVIVKHRKAFENTLLGRSVIKASEDAMSQLVGTVVLGVATVVMTKIADAKLDWDIERLRKTAEKRFNENQQ